MKSVLFLSNRPLEGEGGRPAKYRTRLRRLETLNWRIAFCYAPGPFVRRLPANVFRAWKLSKAEDIDVIHTVCNPVEHPILGLILKLLTGLPLLVEIRDPIVTNPDVEPGTFSWYARRLIEWLYVYFADRIVWHDGIQLEDEYFANTYPGQPKDKFTQLPLLGYDEERFERVSPADLDGFVITYAGSFYDGWIEPYPLLAGLKMYSDEFDESDVRVLFYGDWAESYNERVADLGLDRLVEHRDFVPHDKIVPILTGSDVVLHIGGSDPRNRLSVPSKIWDYIGARTPILAIVDPTFRVAKIIRESGLGVIAPPDDPEAIASAIVELRSGEFSYAPNQDTLCRLRRENNVRELVDVLNDM